MSDTSRKPQPDPGETEPVQFYDKHTTKILADIAKVQEAVSGLKESNKQHVLDFRIVLGGFVALLSTAVGGYLLLSNQISALTSQVSTLTITTTRDATRIETKLDDLSQRLLPPPVAPRR